MDSKKAIIEENLFNPPSGNIRGVIVSMFQVTKTNARGMKTEKVRIAHATIHTDQPPRLTLSVPIRADFENIPAISQALSDFYLKVQELDQDRNSPEA